MYNFTITRIFPVLSTGPILCLKISLLLDLAGLKKKKKNQSHYCWNIFYYHKYCNLKVLGCGDEVPQTIYDWDLQCSLPKLLVC